MKQSFYDCKINLHGKKEFPAEMGKKSIKVLK